ncbi:MAG: hypothetical protein R3F65_06295 [bacterium]
MSALATWLAREVLGVEPGDAIDATDGIDDGTADDSDATDGIDDLDEDDLEALLAAELGDQS